MPVPSRLQALIVAATLTGAAFGVPGSALAQSAGDEQYQDPLAGETSTGGASTPSAPDPSTVPQLSPGTTTSPGSTTSPASPTATAPTPPAGPAPAALADTGLDGRILAGLGAGLLLCGIGLRLRTARERF